MARTAQVKRDARIGEAEARRDAGIKVSIADVKCCDFALINLSLQTSFCHLLQIA